MEVGGYHKSLRQVARSMCNKEILPQRNTGTLGCLLTFIIYVLYEDKEMHKEDRGHEKLCVQVQQLQTLEKKQKEWKLQVVLWGSSRTISVIMLNQLCPKKSYLPPLDGKALVWQGTGQRKRC